MTNTKPDPLVITSTERLVHFRCAYMQCQQWWSIADFGCPPGRWSGTVIYCPRCGSVHRLDNDGVSAE